MPSWKSCFYSTELHVEALSCADTVKWTECGTLPAPPTPAHHLAVLEMATYTHHVDKHHIHMGAHAPALPAAGMRKWSCKHQLGLVLLKGLGGFGHGEGRGILGSGPQARKARSQWCQGEQKWPRASRPSEGRKPLFQGALHPDVPGQHPAGARDSCSLDVRNVGVRLCLPVRRPLPLPLY